MASVPRPNPQMAWTFLNGAICNRQYMLSQDNQEITRKSPDPLSREDLRPRLLFRKGLRYINVSVTVKLVSLPVYISWLRRVNISKSLLYTFIYLYRTLMWYFTFFYDSVEGSCVSSTFSYTVLWVLLCVETLVEQVMCMKRLIHLPQCLVLWLLHSIYIFLFTLPQTFVWHKTVLCVENYTYFTART